jgi:hypothetical protein
VSYPPSAASVVPLSMHAGFGQQPQTSLHISPHGGGAAHPTFEQSTAVSTGALSDVVLVSVAASVDSAGLSSPLQDTTDTRSSIANRFMFSSKLACD